MIFVGDRGEFLFQRLNDFFIENCLGYAFRNWVYVRWIFVNMDITWVAVPIVVPFYQIIYTLTILKGYNIIQNRVRTSYCKSVLRVFLPAWWIVEFFIVKIWCIKRVFKFFKPAFKPKTEFWPWRVIDNLRQCEVAPKIPVVNMSIRRSLDLIICF